MNTTCLLINNEETRKLLPIADCLAISEQAYADVDNGTAIDPPRVNLTAPLSHGHEYVLKSWQSVYPRAHVAAVRLASEVLKLYPYQGHVFARAVPSGDELGYLGLVLLFDLETGNLMAVTHDSAIADLAIASGVGLAARYLSRADASALALLGTGRQARLQCTAIAMQRRLADVRVFYPQAAQSASFSREMTELLGLSVRAVSSAEEAVVDSDIVAAASSSRTCVFATNWLRPGMHISLTRPAEAPRDLFEFADVLITAGTQEPITYASGDTGKLWRQRKTYQPGSHGQVRTLAALINGRVHGRNTAEEVTVYGSLTGYSPGILYAALGAELVARAVRAGLGLNIPSQLFQQANPS
jgi:alanine dehydrogenase